MIPILNETMFERVKPFQLNRGGKTIGHICKFKGKLVYLTHRKPLHFFKKHQGYGIQRSVINKLIQDKRIKHIIIHYRGKKDKKWLQSDVMQWFESDIKEEHTKEFDSGVEDYGIQKIVKEKDMKLIGVDADYKRTKRGLERF